MSDVTLPSYPHDPTGTLAACKITGEQQILTGANSKDYYSVIPKIAPFFRTGLVLTLKNGASSRPLVEGADYDLTYQFIGASRSTAKPVFGGITIKNTALTGVLVLDYQTLGGDWTIDDVRIAQILSDQAHNPRITSWEVVANPPYAYPPTDHQWDLVDQVGLSELVAGVAGIESALRAKGTDSLVLHEADYGNPHRVTANQVGAYTTAQADQKAAALALAAVTDHAGQADPHAQYTTDAEVRALISLAVGFVRQPKNVTPAAQSTNVSTTSTLIGSSFQSLYGLNQTAAQFQVSTKQDFSTLAVDSGTLGAVIQYAVTAGLSANNTYFWRCRHRDSENVWSDWSTPTAFATGSVLISQPQITSPTPGQTGVPTNPVLTSSAFALTGGVDTHASSDWEIWTGANGTGTKAYSVTASAASKTSLAVPAAVLSPNTPYYARVRYNGAGAGTSAWSVDANFTTSGVVKAPTISQPLPNATGVGEQPTITLSAFAVTGGSDTHASTDYQIWSGPNGTGTKVFELAGTTTDKLSTQVPSGKLAVNTTYYARARQNGTTLGPSAWSGDCQFTTAATFVPTVIGQAFQGGFYVGRVQDASGDKYAIIVAPKASGQTSIGFTTYTNGLGVGMGDRSNGALNCAADPSSPATVWVKSLTIGGYGDWYVPALDELELVYRACKPTTEANKAGAGAYTYNPSGADGINPSSSPTGAAYTSANPAQTTIAAFQAGNVEELPAILASSTAKLTGENYFQLVQYMSGVSGPGNQAIGTLGGSYPIRAIRRVKIS